MRCCTPSSGSGLVSMPKGPWGSGSLAVPKCCRWDRRTFRVIQGGPGGRERRERHARHGLPAPAERRASMLGGSCRAQALYLECAAWLLLIRTKIRLDAVGSLCIPFELHACGCRRHLVTLPAFSGLHIDNFDLILVSTSKTAVEGPGGAGSGARDGTHSRPLQPGDACRVNT